jgi:hypothetical protein
MRAPILIIMAISLINYPSVAQSREEKEVAASVETLRKAMVDANESVLKDLASDDLSYGHSSGTIEDKAAFVKSIVSGSNDFKTLDFSEQTIKILDNTALVRNKFTAEMLNKGVTSNTVIYVLQVWQKQSGKWKLIARQAFKLPQ